MDRGLQSPHTKCQFAIRGRGVYPSTFSCYRGGFPLRLPAPLVVTAYMRSVSQVGSRPIILSRPRPPFYVVLLGEKDAEIVTCQASGSVFNSGERLAGPQLIGRLASARSA